MAIDPEVSTEIVKQSGGVIGKAYDDLIHPSAQSLGNTLSLLPRSIGVFLKGWEKWVINGEESIQLTAEAVKDKASKIPEEKLTEPEPYVAVPAIQQLSYCYNSEELRAMYANLLVSSMNSDTKYKVHPAFVDIIKQLTPDEAKILKLISEKKTYYPLIEVQLKDGNGHGYTSLMKNYTTLGNTICENAQNICSYIENLDRLRLICIQDGISLTAPGAYDELDNSEAVEAIKQLPFVERNSVTTAHNAFYVTEFGSNFISTCIS